MLRLVLLLISVLIVGGCARWEQTEATGGLKFPRARLAHDTVVLEIGLIQLDQSQTSLFENFWQVLDQQELDLSRRQVLDQNGIRVAIMASHAPAELNRLLESRPIELENLDLVEQQMADRGILKPKSRKVLHQRISNRDGQTYPIPTSEIHPELSWQVFLQGRQSVGTGESVRGVVDVTTYPQGNGTVRLQFQPQIHHGQIRPTFGVAAHEFFLESRQSIVKLSDLVFDLNVRAGETVVISPTADVKDLGYLFFGNPEPASIGAGSDTPIRPSPFTHRVLLVRVVQTQMDDLFGNNHRNEKLSSTSHH